MHAPCLYYICQLYIATIEIPHPGLYYNYGRELTGHGLDLTVIRSSVGRLLDLFECPLACISNLCLRESNLDRFNYTSIRFDLDAASVCSDRVKLQYCINCVCAWSTWLEYVISLSLVALYIIPCTKLYYTWSNTCLHLLSYHSINAFIYIQLKRPCMLFFTHNRTSNLVLFLKFRCWQLHHQIL